MNKKAIITILLALIAVAGISNAFDFRIDDEDVAIVVNKDIAWNDIPDEETAVGIVTDRIFAVEANGGHVGVNGNLRSRFSIFHKVLLQDGHDGTTVETSKGVKLIERVWEYGIGLTCGWLSPRCASYSSQRRRSSSVIASIRLFSASCAPSLPCETDLRMS